MENLEQLQNRLEERLKNMKTETERLSKEFEMVSALKEIETPLLLVELCCIKKLKTQKTESFNIKYYKGNYDNILGGDGRSSVFSEAQTGFILELESLKYFLTEKQKNILELYLLDLGTIDNLIVKYA